MIANFPISLEMVLVHEGGFVDHPADPGGATNKGITQRTLSAHLGRQATIHDVRNISDATVAAIYRRSYWDASRCSLLPAGLDYAVFDFAVNSGVSRAIRTLQRCVGVADDAVIGEITLDAIWRANVVDLIERYCDARMSFLRGLRTFKTFGRGWTRRVMGAQVGVQHYDEGVIDRATAMVVKVPVQMPRVVNDGANRKADEAQKKWRMSWPF